MASNTEILKKLDEVNDEILKSRKMNKDDHEGIIDTANDIKGLSNQITEFFEKFKGFNYIIKVVKSSVITLGVFWLIFKDMILNTFT